MFYRSKPLRSQLVAIAICLGVTASTSAQLPITTGLFVNLNGSIIAYLNDKYFVGEPTIPGDYDGSTVVDENDYALWYQLFGSGDLQADGNGDQAINAADYVIWRNNLGAQAPLEFGSGATVPEPASLAMLAIGLAVLSARRAYRCLRIEERHELGILR